MAVAMTSVVPTVVTHLPTQTGSARSHSVSLNLVILTDNGCVYLTEGYPSVGENYAWRWCVIGGSGMSYHGGSSGTLMYARYSLSKCCFRRFYALSDYTGRERPN